MTTISSLSASLISLKQAAGGNTEAFALRLKGQAGEPPRETVWVPVTLNRDIVAASQPAIYNIRAV